MSGQGSRPRVFFKCIADRRLCESEAQRCYPEIQSRQESPIA